MPEYVCKSCGKPIELKPKDTSLQFSIEASSSKPKVYVVNCEHCGTANRLEVRS